MQERPPRYRAYMLRCWEARGESPDQPGTWRFSLECVQTKEKRGFVSLEDLVAWLRKALKRNAEDQSPDAPGIG